MYVALGPRELGGVLDVDQDDEEEVVPHVVLRADVVVKRHMLVLERLPLQAADETRVLQRLFFLLFLRPEVGESVDDDAKDEVENDNDDDEEEEHVVEDPEGEQGLVVGRGPQHVSDPSPVPQTCIKNRVTYILCLKEFYSFR